MRYPVLTLLLAATTATPVLAQSNFDAERRIDRLERELRAVQRRVFPNGAGTAPLTPEIVPPDAPIAPPGVPATSAIADLTSRLDALEGQLRGLTGQAEENAHKLSQMEKALADFRAATDSRLTTIEKPGAAEPSLTAPAATPPVSFRPGQRPSATTEAAPPPATGDAAEDAYLAGFRLWEAKDYAKAQATLETWVKKYPKHPRGSFARNLLGRAYLDGGKPATAAKVLLDNYETNSSGERAPDSLFYLGQALVQLNQAANACKVYDELESVYGTKLRAALRQELPKARTTARCK